MPRNSTDVIKQRKLEVLKQDWLPGGTHETNGACAAKLSRDSICDFCCSVGSVPDSPIHLRPGALMFGGKPQWLNINLVAIPDGTHISECRYLTKANNDYVGATLQMLEDDFVARQTHARDAGRHSKACPVAWC